MNNSVKTKKQKVMVVISVLLSGLVAGLLYAYACSVNPGLNKLSDAAYLSAMQSINTAIQNPVFFISFMGALIVLPVAAIQLRVQQMQAFYCMLGAAALYVIGVFGVTIFANVPLNNRLANFNITSASLNDLTAMRTLFEKPWNTFHLVRTIASIGSFVLSVIALVKIK